MVVMCTERDYNGPSITGCYNGHALINQAALVASLYYLTTPHIHKY